MAVRPEVQGPVWLRRMRKQGERELPRNVRGMPAVVPVLREEQYSLSEAVGRLFDSTILSNDALRPLTGAWCSLSESACSAQALPSGPFRAAAGERRSIAAAEAGRSDAVARRGQSHRTRVTGSRRVPTRSDVLVDDDSPWNVPSLTAIGAHR